MSSITSETFGTGKAGDITIAAGTIKIMDGGWISTSTRAGSEGDGGSITIQAEDSVNILTASLTSETNSRGKAGDITIESGTLNVADWGFITTSAREGSEGDGGSILIRARDTVNVSGGAFVGDDFLVSSITSETFGRGKAGDLSIETGTFSVTDGGWISTTAREGSEGEGGSISITARDSVNLSGIVTVGEHSYASKVASDTYSKGAAGNITITTKNLMLSDSGQISSKSEPVNSEGLAMGNAGSICLDVSGLLYCIQH